MISDRRSDAEAGHTFVLIPGAGSTSWYWHLVVPLLEARGHRTITPDLPCDDTTATFDDYRDAVLDAIGDPPDDLVLVAQSLGGYTAPLVADRIPVRMIVLVAAMVPLPGEPAGAWWTSTGADHASAALAADEGRDPDDLEAMFTHDVPPAVVVASRAHQRDQSDAPFAAPFPLDAWPEVPTRYLLCRDDRFLPADVLRRVVRERLGIVPDEMPGGHCPALAHPEELADRLHAYVTG